MGVIRTDQWLLSDYKNPIQLCERLAGYFQASAEEVYDYLYLHGMYFPTDKGEKSLNTLLQKNPWKVVEAEYEILSELWGGPDIPIFLFPIDESVYRVQGEGKSGLAFHDKLFLFLSDAIPTSSLRALLTHEYNHVCRLIQYPKLEDEYILLDTIILEGMAEYAVLERFGTSYQANWLSFYTEMEVQEIWRDVVYPNKDVRKTAIKHQEVLFGTDAYPTMAGYCVGYYLVKKCVDANHLTSRDLLKLPTKTIVELATT
ncbi:DUF2268 domain-containing protein [Ornithinibacillus contaminans]|uniref:DUF2268 domain-containing protein n=1 Tax=Ornithinibacillus contaminans TaxID=694055 RepID=UPI00064DAD27|nr:DUF2268 domain-containing putative Zn-dependent protease [Ornithinibacillus contaminans]